MDALLILALWCVLAAIAATPGLSRSWARAPPIMAN